MRLPVKLTLSLPRDEYALRHLRCRCRSAAQASSGFAAALAAVLLIVTALMHATGSSHDRGVFRHLRFVATYARSNDTVVRDGKKLNAAQAGVWMPAHMIADEVNGYLHEPDNVAAGEPVYDVYAAAGLQPLLHEQRESVEVDSALSNSHRLVLSSRSQTGSIFELQARPSGPLEISRVRSGGYIWQSHFSSLGEEEAALALLLALIWAGALAIEPVGKWRLASERSSKQLSEWRRLVAGSSAPAAPQEGFELLVPHKRTHHNGDGSVDVEFAVSRERWEHGRWVRLDWGGAETLRQIWPGQLRWPASTPFAQLAEAWISFLDAVGQANQRSRHDEGVQDEGIQDDLQLQLEQQLRTIALLETPQEMAARQLPVRRSLLRRS